MSETTPTQLPLSLLRRLLGYISLDWVSFALDVVQGLRRYFCTEPAGPYEILDYDAVLELLDVKGKRSVFRKRQRVKFLQNGIIAFEDYAWGDGDIFVDYRCSPGFVADRYKQGDRWNILVSLRETKSIGEIEQFHIEQKGRNVYLKHEEWLQTEIRRHTRHLKMCVIFPRRRHCKVAALFQRRANRTSELDTEHFDILPDGRQIVWWETNHVQAYEVYTLKWRW